MARDDLPHKFQETLRNLEAACRLAEHLPVQQKGAVADAIAGILTALRADAAPGDSSSALPAVDAPPSPDAPADAASVPAADEFVTKAPKAMRAANVARGAPTGQMLSWLARDLAVDRRAGAAMRRTNELLERMFDNIHVLVAYMDAQFNFIRVNRAYARSDGRDESFFVGKNHFDLYPDSENEAIFRSVVETGEPVTSREKPFEYPENPDRGVTYWDWTLEPVKGASGRAVGVVLSMRDVTQQKRAEMALRESERRYRALMEQASDAILTFDPRGRVLEANSRACEMTGYGADELLALSMTDLLEDASGASPFDEEAMVEGATVVDERSWRRKDGAFIAVEATGRLLDDGRLQVIARDVSRRKRVDEEIRAYQQRLRLMASQLSLAEEHERRRIAKDIHDHVGQTLALCQIKLGELQESASTPDLKEALRDIRNHIYWIITCTRSLTFELGSPILYELGLEAAVQEAAEQLQTGHGIAAVFVDDGRPKPLSGDLRMVLFRAVREVLANVVKHARASNVRVSIGTDGRHAVIRVEDDGLGFDVAEAPAGVSRNGGFGLFSIRERLDYLGGSLHVDSSPGRGTRVTLRAPLMQKSL